MKKPLGCLSLTGFLAAFIVLIAVLGYTLLNGGGLFSPGPVTAASSRGTPLEGYRSHADFESRCTLCHSPWQGPDPLRCVACHTNVRDQIADHSGLHGRLENPDRCTLCHTDHRGREANITAVAVANFPHQEVGFSLARHRQRADGQPFACADCHPSADYTFDQALCERCHADLDRAFTTQHVADFGRDCLSCHDGTGTMAGFDHATVFPLEGAHADLACTDCHVNRQFKGLASDCVACHEEPDIHRGQFGTDCAACHSTEAWTPARLREHTFPLNHGSRTEVKCQVCHPTNYVTYTCYNCHEHDPARVERKHLEEGIRNFENCVECHPTGREEEGKRGDD
ncbi:MAG: hypothetical protein D6759_10290 [Chloroflexi bacterium]|nr:MAG: hypothetical protein D6759_10290 [Chloroflexota bacterium]